MTLLREAISWHQLGATPVPVQPDGTKRPAVTSWKDWQDQQPAVGEVITAFQADHDGLGLICGRASGGLELLELEGRAVDTGLVEQLQQTFADHGMDELWQRIDRGYSEQTPGGGIHWYYRVDCAPVAGNTRLARDAEKRVLIETRGQGGFTVIAPSAGRTHPTGRAYAVRTGRPETIPTLTADEYAAVHVLAGLLDQAPAAEPDTGPTARPRQPGDPLRPGDDFNTRATWDEILTPHGWTLHSRIGQSATWRKPGKRRPGISATTGRAADADRLFVFSTSTEFEPEKPYSKFAAYAVLNHGGDHSTAARALREAGYGEQTEIGSADPLAGLLPPAARTESIPSPGATAVAATATAPQRAPILVDADRAAQAYGPTEDGTARALAHLHRHQLRYCAQRGSWLHWGGARWMWDTEGQHREYIKALARPLPEDDAAWRKYKVRALSATGTAGIAKQAETDPAFAVHIDHLDANPWEINTPGGVVDLRTGTIREPDPAALHTRSTSVAPDFTRTPDRWHRFLSDTFGGNQQLIAYVQRLLGVSIIGTVLEQHLAFLHGSGANGKSTLVETAMDVLGRGETGYAIAAPSEMLMVRRFSEHPAELAQLAGARLVVCSELEDGARFAEARIKQLTGRDSINARFMRSNPFTFTPSHSLWLIANHKPEVTTGGPAFWRRLRTVPFDHVVPEGERDAKLPDRLAEEAPGILAWIITGAAAYANEGLITPDAVTRATAAYAAEADTVGRFVEECCHTGTPQLQAPTGKLREAYEAWCREQGDTPVSARRLTQELVDRFGVTPAKAAKGQRIYRGIGLIVEDQGEERYR